MKRLIQQLNLSTVPKWIPITLLIVAFIGFSDALYLTVEHYQNIIPPCTIGGCETVLTSSYAAIFGIPTALLGSIYYFILIVSLFLFLDFKKEILLRIPIVFSFLGAIASIWFVYLMIFVIKAFCPYCAVSAVTSLIIFCLSLWTRYLSLRVVIVQE
jgi:uncharacterized membrane protein